MVSNTANTVLFDAFGPQLGSNISKYILHLSTLSTVDAKNVLFDAFGP